MIFNGNPATRTAKVCTLSKPNSFLFFFLFVFFKDYWTPPPKRQPEESESGKKYGLREGESFLAPYPTPWPFFLFASLCTVPTNLTPENPLPLMCTLSQKFDFFRNVSKKKKFKGNGLQKCIEEIANIARIRNLTIASRRKDTLSDIARITNTKLSESSDL